MKTIRLLTLIAAVLTAVILCQNAKAAQGRMAANGSGVAFVIVSHDGNTGVLLNNGTGKPGAPVNYSPSNLGEFTSEAATVGDADDDGEPDLIAVGSETDTNAYTVICYLSGNLNDGNGTFLNGKPFQVPRRSLALKSAHLDSDGSAEGVALGFGRRGFTITQFTGSGATLSVASQVNSSTNDGLSYEGFAVPLTFSPQGRS